MAYSSTLVIQELRENGASGRVLELQGGGLPFMGADWGGENNLQTSWYPGNGAEGSQQILGPREVPSNWSGEWKRTILSRSRCKYADGGSVGFIVNPHSLALLFESMLRGGQRLRVTWSVVGDTPDQTGSILREGRARNWKFNYERIQDLKWTVNFEWVSRGGAKQTPVNTRDESVQSALSRHQVELGKAIDAANFQLSRLRKKNAFDPKRPDRLTLGQLEQLAGAPNALVKGIGLQLANATTVAQRLSSIVSLAASQPFAMSNSLLEIARSTMVDSYRVIDRITRIPGELQSSNNGAAGVMRAVKRFGTVTDSMLAVARGAAQIEKFYRPVVSQLGLRGELSVRTASRAGDVIAIHVAHEGDTPTSLSIRYYNTPDHAVDILKANRKPWYVAGFRLGEPLVIPAINPTTMV